MQEALGRIDTFLYFLYFVLFFKKIILVIELDPIVNAILKIKNKKAKKMHEKSWSLDAASNNYDRTLEPPPCKTHRRESASNGQYNCFFQKKTKKMHEKSWSLDAVSNNYDGALEPLFCKTCRRKFATSTI